MSDAPRSAARIWRRGPAPAAAGPHDYGYFGPESVIWRVVAHPATTVMGAQATLLFQIPHRELQAVVLDHDRTLKTALGGRGQARQLVNRLQRTLGVPVPMIFGDTPSADRVAAHLRRFHTRMTGDMPDSSGARYDAQSQRMVVFAHVTLFHAFLRTYEALAFNGTRRPTRLSDAERDRYFAELVPFAELMGAPASIVPDSVSAVRDYYASISDCYEPLPQWHGVLRQLTIGGAIRPARWRDLPALPAATAIGATNALAIAVTPRPVRRLTGIPARLDPLLDRLLDAVRPSFAPLAIPAISDLVVRGLIGPENLDLTHAAREML